ncbi:class I SAM-dependent methyltransferase [Clostridium sp. C2-6-12]|uniref:class I SAM-dependent methyltransferase n=1 Tax=Clostridium sp. C2-6-12 TaxID=2698832 RepID=UPI001369C879|nr:class I SAM-dependent methyltransferase [Clostridium sp. C2-6-12]
MENAIIDYYNAYDEDGRFFRNNGHQIEIITSMTYFKKLFKKGSFILDGCAGTGNYSFKLAELGHKVIAGDIVPHNVDIIRDKQNTNPILKDIYTGNITDLTRFENEMFDVVLCMGAFYHIDNEDRNIAMSECLRVLKPKGLLVISYINNMAVSVYSLNSSNKLENIEQAISSYNNKTRDGIFLNMSPLEIEQIAQKHNAKIVAHIAADGIGYLLSDKINQANKEDFDKWIQFHLKTCEDKSLLGYSLHGLIILEKV